jgi:serine/threonine protein kinase
MSVAWKRKYCRTKITAQAQREIGIIKRLNHRHIIKLVGTYTHGPFLGLLLWPVMICDLATFLTDVDNLTNEPNLDDDTAIERLVALGIGGGGSIENARIAAVRRLKQSLGCITGAIVYLHENHIKHKDLKPSNVLLGPEALYITDFGTSTHFENTVSLSQDGDRGTPKYFSPEVANFQPSGRAADIFSLGCIFFEIVGLCNRRSLAAQKALRPDHDSSFQANLSHMTKFFDFDEGLVESDIDQHLFSKIRLMLKEDPQQRPTAAAIEHYLRIIDAFNDDSGAIPLWGPCCSPTPTPLTSLPPSVGTLKLTVGNTHQGDGRQHTWNFFIRSSHDELIDKVLVILVCTVYSYQSCWLFYVPSFFVLITSRSLY